MSVRTAHPNSLAAAVSDPKSPEAETGLQLGSDSRQGGQSSSCRMEKSGGCPSKKSSPSMTDSPEGEPDADRLLQRRRSQLFNEGAKLDTPGSTGPAAVKGDSARLPTTSFRRRRSEEKSSRLELSSKRLQGQVYPPNVDWTQNRICYCI